MKETVAMHTFRTLLVGAIALTTVGASQAATPAAKAPPPAPVLTLAAQCGVPFQDNAVLQQKIPLPVWGMSLPGAKVTVSFDGQTQTTVAVKDGTWRVVLDPMTAVRLKTVNDCPEGQTMRIVCAKDGEEAVTAITNLVMGDVWLCAGQSNMAGRMKRAGHPKNYPANSVNNANYPALRRLNVAENKWEVCSPETAIRISRVSFFFARRVQRDALVPMGLMVTAVGGSNIESWLNQTPYPTGGNYTRLISPLVGYGIRGAIWYQGESNEKDKRGYQPKLVSLITGWRKAWEQGDFPAYFVQLPGIGSSSIVRSGCSSRQVSSTTRRGLRAGYVGPLRVEYLLSSLLLTSDRASLDSGPGGSGQRL